MTMALLADQSALAAINDSVGKFCTDNWTERKRYQPMVQNKLLSTIQAYSLGFLTGNPMPWKRSCLFCLFHASLSIVDCSIQLVYTKFPNRVINRALRMAGVFCQRAELRPSIGTVRRTPTHRRLCWRMRLRGDSHPPAGRPRGAPLLWTGLESRFPRGVVGGPPVVALLDRSVRLCLS